MRGRMGLRRKSELLHAPTGLAQAWRAVGAASALAVPRAEHGCYCTMDNGHVPVWAGLLAWSGQRCLSWLHVSPSLALGAHLPQAQQAGAAGLAQLAGAAELAQQLEGACQAAQQAREEAEQVQSLLITARVCSVTLLASGMCRGDRPALMEQLALLLMAASELFAGLGRPPPAGRAGAHGAACNAAAGGWVGGAGAGGWVGGGGEGALQGWRLVGVACIWKWGPVHVVPSSIRAFPSCFLSGAGAAAADGEGARSGC